MAPRDRQSSTREVILLLALFFASGAAALIVQVLWLRQLSLLVGATAYAAAAVLAIFFLGQALGSLFWGERSRHVHRPLRLYAFLELGIAVAATTFYALAPLQLWLSSWLTSGNAEIGSTARGLQLALASLLLLPATTLQGGTLPVLGRFLIRQRAELGRQGALLYTVNTLGAACGALAAGFFLLAWLGVARSYALAIALNAGTGCLALWLSRNETPMPAESEAKPASDAPPMVPVQVLALAALSGFAAIGLEVLWTRMFAQVLHNSAYSFSAILVTFLVALGLGAVLARRIAGLGRALEETQVALLLCIGAAVAASPWMFWMWTNGMEYIAPQASWRSYLEAIFVAAAAVLLIPGTLVGALYPFTLQLAARQQVAVGPVLGRLAAANTLGAIAGSLIAGFVLLPYLGLWASIQAIAMLYLTASVLLAGNTPTLPTWLRLAPAAVLFVFATGLDPSRLPIVRLDERASEILYGSWESAYGVTAVVRSDKSLRLKMDNYYSLGGTASLTYQRTQADIPLILQANADQVFVLGMGSGTTAGTVLNHAVERVVVAELVPEVVTATRRFFGPYSNGLFEDPRVRILVGDGRHLLHASAQRYDLILGDLFIPWQAGAGSLYTREHFATVRDRLAPGGSFAQWLPLYQLTREQTFSIVHTLLEVFPQVTLWRGDFMPNKPIVALVAQAEAAPLDPQVVVRNYRRRPKNAEAPRDAVLALTGMFYAGNLSENRALFATAPINTDDRPWLELNAPITQRQQSVQQAAWFTDMPLLAWYDQLAANVPPDRDPYLALLQPEERDGVRGGLSLLRSKALLAAGDRAGAEAASAEFSRLVPQSAYALLGNTGAANTGAAKNRIP